MLKNVKNPQNSEPTAPLNAQMCAEEEKLVKVHYSIVVALLSSIGMYGSYILYANWG